MSPASRFHEHYEAPDPVAELAAIPQENLPSPFEEAVPSFLSYLESTGGDLKKDKVTLFEESFLFSIAQIEETDETDEPSPLGLLRSGLQTIEEVRESQRNRIPYIKRGRIMGDQEQHFLYELENFSIIRESQYSLHEVRVTHYLVQEIMLRISEEIKTHHYKRKNENSKEAQDQLLMFNRLNRLDWGLATLVDHYFTYRRFWNLLSR